jgi:low affinity Fe/Cu permease
MDESDRGSVTPSGTSIDALGRRAAASAALGRDLDERAADEAGGSWFTRLVGAVTTWAGSVWALVTAVGLIVAWAVTGPLFHFSSTWQLMINTGTTIVTFLMVFVIQNSQNRDGRAIQTKLDEILHCITDADDSLIGIEDLSEHDIEHIQKQVRETARRQDRAAS